MIDAALAASVESAGLTAPPSSPSPGQCWIVGSAPTGIWSDHPDALACWTESGWRFVPPVEGLVVWVKDQQLWGVRESAGWAIGKARADEISIGGSQVVGPQQPAITPISGGSVVDVEARAAIASIVSRLTAHGLIAS